ncbi:hypothetical protein CAPTEDRAFT_159294 [Capitella teleta]|uniref:Isopropylmalate dehydrogenase-like domain-containing protein n=1 Tax=Capitella teleta TaxID=283909 RepID=R7U3H1_CAPTE|nr:hypothetical protein CAPTEDRAFT_159294 [Capitella teleta]|eukprot:ELU00676.1 hypothetical protein CAPTEDRAFT_159294 [Capitella teleta]
MSLTSSCRRILRSNLVTRSGFQKLLPAVSRSVHCSSVKEQKLHSAKYGGRHCVTMLPGDGVGPEMMLYVREVFKSVGAPVDFEEVQMDHTSTDTEYDHAILSLKRNGIAIKGNVESGNLSPDATSRNVELRADLDLFANVVVCKSNPGVKTRHNNIDVVIIRENTEGEYSNLEHETVGGVVESLKIITERKSTRIAKYAFDYALRHGRKKVTAVHKANIMKMGDGLFLESCHKVSEMYPTIEFDSMIVDNCSMQMVSRPEQFDVMVLPNLYGNILANIATGLIGGAGIVSGVNIGEKYAIFELGTRNTGKKIAGKNIANPTAMLRAGSDLLGYLGLHLHSDMITNALDEVLQDEQMHTADLGGQATSAEVVQRVISLIQKERNI